MPERRKDTLPKNRRATAVRRAPGAGPARRMSRKEREALQRKRLYWSMGLAGTLVVVVLLIFSSNDYWFKPRHVLATVNGTEIRRRDYWKVRSFDLINQINTYSNYAQNPALSSDQQSQYASFAQSAANDLKTAWGSTSVDDSTLSRMVEDQIYLQNAGDLGVNITNQDVNDYVTQLFQPSDAPLITPTPTATLIPTRAAWATETAQALTATAGAAAGTPLVGSSSPVASAGTPIAVIGTPVAISASPGASQGSPVAKPASGEATPVGGGTAAPTVSAATPNVEQAQATVTATYTSFKSVTLKAAHMSETDFDQLIVKPAVAREKVKAALDDRIGQSTAQVHAAHILVGTKDLADSIYAQVTAPGADFEQIAKNQSEDAATAPNGGDLGWIAKGEMVPEFEQVVFSLKPGEISHPFQTQYGWHVVKVYETDPNRPMTDAQLTAVQNQTLDEWVAAQRKDMKITSEAAPTATPSVKSFVPPVGAPPTPTATVEPAASPVASPDASPVG